MATPAQPSTFTLEPTGDGAALESVDCTAAAQCLVVDLAGDLLSVALPRPPRPATGGSGAPTISGARLTFSHSGQVALHFAVHAGTGAPPLSSLSYRVAAWPELRLPDPCLPPQRSCQALLGGVKGLTVGVRPSPARSSPTAR